MDENLKKIIFTESYSIRSELYNFYLNIKSFINRNYNINHEKKINHNFIDSSWS